MVPVTQESLPTLFMALLLIEHDNAGIWAEDKDAYETHGYTEEQLAEFEVGLSSLLPEDLEDFVIGDEEVMESIAEKYGLQDVHKFLNDYFDDFPNRD